jgi:protoporphyrinogen oxidase
LRRSVSPHFWVNIGQTDREIPGVIEFSNLRDLGSVIVYVPYYMPVTNEKFQWSDEKFISDAFGCLTELNPALVSADLIEATVARLGNAQPICDVGFAAKIPPVQAPISGLQIADTCFYYPEDRGIAQSVRLGRAMADTIPSIGKRLTAE